MLGIIKELGKRLRLGAGGTLYGFCLLNLTGLPAKPVGSQRCGCVPKGVASHDHRDLLSSSWASPWELPLLSRPPGTSDMGGSALIPEASEMSQNWTLINVSRGFWALSQKYILYFISHANPDYIIQPRSPEEVIQPAHRPLWIFVILLSWTPQFLKNRFESVIRETQRSSV